MNIKVLKRKLAPATLITIVPAKLLLTASRNTHPSLWIWLLSLSVPQYIVAKTSKNK
jgi:hypothetical protein